MFNRAALHLILVAGLLGASAARATGCVSPDLDRAFENADLVFVARLTSASAVDLFYATGTFTIEHSLKGNAPETVSLHANIDPMLNCELELTIGKHYLIFLNKGQVTLSYENGSGIVGGRYDILEWLDLRKQSR